MPETIAAIATGNLVSAIGIVRISGDKSIELVDKLFKPLSSKLMSSYADRKLVYGNLCNAEGEILDICLCTISRGPNSYTGEDTAEFQCHGSPVVLRAVLDELFKLGARQAGPGEFTKRAFLNGRMDLTSAEAVIDIIDAESAESAKNAAGQLAGAIGNKADEIYSKLTDMASHYHVVLDYPDEDLEEFELEDYKATVDEAIVKLERLVSTFSRGKLMQLGIPAAIIGRPNAGKSSLLNALVGYDRAIVTNIPGTTRDTIEEKVKLGSVTLRLIDTAGICETDDEIERMGVERTFSEIEKADLVIAVHDGNVEINSQDEIIFDAARKANKGIIVISKADLPQADANYDFGDVPVVRLSSNSGEGLNELEKVVEEIYPLPAVPTGEILTNARQAETISRALDSLKAAKDAMEMGHVQDIVLTEIEEAMDAIGQLTGKSVGEDITHRIFSRFCVGK